MSNPLDNLMCELPHFGQNLMELVEGAPHFALVKKPKNRFMVFNRNGVRSIELPRCFGGIRAGGEKHELFLSDLLGA